MENVLERHIGPRASELMQHLPSLVIEGARQIGKSTLATQLAGAGAVVANLDDERTRTAALADQPGFVAQAGTRPLVIDQIQRLPELTLVVKAAIDRDRRPGRFILTSSSSLLHVRGTADSLAGRAARLQLYGLSRGEALGVADDFATAVLSDPERLRSTASSWSRADYTQMLAVGAYSEIRDSTDVVRDAWMEGYLEGIVGRDMAELRKEVRPARTHAILRTLAGRQSFELVKAKLAQETAVPPRTITGYLDLLHDVGLVDSVPRWTANLSKREIGRSKTFVIDSGLAPRLARVSPRQLADFPYSEALGSFVAAFIAAELARQRTWSAERYDIYHWRDRDTDEVDIVLECGDGRVIGIEVKAASSFSAKQFKGLTKLRDRLGDKFVAGIVLNTTDSGYRLADRLYGAPVSALWEFRP